MERFAPSTARRALLSGLAGASLARPASASEAYRPALGLKRYVRHVLCAKLDLVLALDEIEAQPDTSLELLFHTGSAPVPQPDGRCVATGQRASLYRRWLTPEGVECRSGIIPIQARHPKPGKQAVKSTPLPVSAKGPQWRYQIAFQAAPAGAMPCDVTVRKDAAQWRIRTKSHTFVYDIHNLRFSEEHP